MEVIDKPMNIGIKGVHKYLPAYGDGIDTEESAGAMKYRKNTIKAQA